MNVPIRHVATHGMGRQSHWEGQPVRPVCSLVAPAPPRPNPLYAVMRYPEPKEQTIPLLRLVLAQMGQHDAAFNPVTFAVFYEHAATTNPRLSAAFEAAQQATARLGDAAMRQLYNQHIAEADSAETERVRANMQQMMTSIAESAARTGATAGNFGATLDDLSGALANTGGTALAAQLDATRASTQAMRSSVQALQEQVANSQREVEQLRTDLSRTRQEATLCSLTKVLNRRGFDAQLSHMLSEPPPKGAAHCLVMLDIDHFKRVNDTHGHVVGDRVIAGLGEVLRSVPAEPGMACARYGGEEFAILLPRSTLGRAMQVAEAVRTRTRAMKLRNRDTQEVLVNVTVSAGVAAWHPGDDAASLVSCADAALYRSKEGGRDRVTAA